MSTGDTASKHLSQQQLLDQIQQDQKQDKFTFDARQYAQPPESHVRQSAPQQSAPAETESVNADTPTPIPATPTANQGGLQHTPAPNQGGQSSRTNQSQDQGGPLDLSNTSNCQQQSPLTPEVCSAVVYPLDLNDFFQVFFQEEHRQSIKSNL